MFINNLNECQNKFYFGTCYGCNLCKLQGQYNYIIKEVEKLFDLKIDYIKLGIDLNKDITRDIIDIEKQINDYKKDLKHIEREIKKASIKREFLSNQE